MEKALHALGLPDDPDRRLAQSYGLRPELMAMSNAWRTADGGRSLIAAKGAPETIAPYGLYLPLRKRVDALAAACVFSASRVRTGRDCLPSCNGRFPTLILVFDPLLHYRGTVRI
jgi:hypothetical protein